MIHGVTVRDPYRWLEGDGPDVTAWMEAEDARTRRRFAELADVETRWKEMLALWRPAAVVQRTKPSDGVVARVTAALPSGTRVTRVVPSRDGTRIAIELSKSGADMRTLDVVDAANGALSDELVGIEDSKIVWSDAGFFYAFTPPDAPHATRWSERDVRFHRPGDAQAHDRVVVSASHDPNASSGMNPVAITDDGKNLLVRTFGNWARTTYAVVDLARWDVYPLAEASDVSGACVVGSSIFAALRTSSGATDIVRVRGDGAPTVVGHADARFLGLESLGAFLLERHARGASVDTEFYDADFHLLATRHAEPGVTESFASGDPITIAREGLRTPPERVAFDPRTGRETKLATSPSAEGFDADALVIDVAEAISKDGTRVPITVLRRKDVARDGRAPLWLYGYGGFRVSAEQIFFPPWIAWSVRGGVFAICHARGGLEWGEAWHEGGARLHRQNSIDDFVACANELHHRGYASPARTMTQGWSHGGLLVSAAAVQHPEIQRVVLASVPLTDMIRFPLFGRGGVSEYGDPSNEPDFRALLGFSPVQNIRDGVRYPSFIVTVATQDERAAPMHARKLVAALQHASTGGEVFLEVNWGAAHHGGGKADGNRVFAEAASYALREFER